MGRARQAGLLATLVATVSLVTGCYGGGSAGGGPRIPLFAVDQQTQAVYRLLNNDRGFWGKPPLAWNDKLGGLAVGWSQYMAASGSFAHRDLNAVINDPDYGEFWSLGENILLGSCSMSPNQIEQAWMSSTDHRANILGNYNVVGAGVTCTSSGRLYATQDFGRL